MRFTVFVATLVAAAAANVVTITQTQDVTVTSCGSAVTDCPGKPTSAAEQWQNWGQWSSLTTSAVTTSETSTTASASQPGSSTTSSIKQPETSTTVSKPASTTPVASSWTIWTTSTTLKPVITTTTTSAAAATTTWAQWQEAGCPTYTASGPPEWFSLLPSEAASSMGAKWTAGPPSDWCSYTYSTAKPTAPYGTGKPPGSYPTGTGGYKPTTTNVPVPTWTGAATVNVGNMAFAGLAGLAALVFA